MTKDIPEITWQFKFHKDLSPEKIDLFIDNFVLKYVERNNWYCGGGQSQMGMYDLHGKTSETALKQSLIEYLKNDTDVVHSIIIDKYDEAEDVFLPVEEILISTSNQKN